MRTGLKRFGAAGLAMLVGATTAQALTVPEATISYEYVAGAGNEAAGPFSETLTGGDIGNLTVEAPARDSEGRAGVVAINATLGRQPTVSVFAGATNTLPTRPTAILGAGGSGSISLEYFVTLEPADPGRIANVPVMIEAVGAAAAAESGVNARAAARGSLSVDGNNLRASVEAESGDAEAGPRSFRTSSTLFIRCSIGGCRPLPVQMTAFASAGASNTGSDASPGVAAGTVTIDPLFTVDPAFADDFTLRYSPAIEAAIAREIAAAAVPAPGAFGLLALGLGGLAALRRRR